MGKDTITIDLNRFRQLIGSYTNAYGDIAISVTRLNIALERSEICVEQENREGGTR